MAPIRASSTSSTLTIRAAEPADAPFIAAIHNQGIEEREATFDTEPRSPDGVRRRIERGDLFLVAERAGWVIGAAWVSRYSDREVYDGVGEATVYVHRDTRRTGAGGALVDALAQAAERRGMYKLVGLTFTTNRPSIELLRDRGFRDVGVHRRHGRLDGAWRDVLVVELLIGNAASRGLPARRAAHRPRRHPA
ncbi:MAG TPA: GNAT family N-acetyltransferase [Thermoleophilaceae bacterium]|nr:GNAT family N-acetyltransferase [Thermoleophilaceae bacterium]